MNFTGSEYTQPGDVDFFHPESLKLRRVVSTSTPNLLQTNFTFRTITTLETPGGKAGSDFRLDRLDIKLSSPKSC